MTAVAAQTMTVEQCLKSERRSEVRHEYVGGALLPIPGTTRTHGHIAANILVTLRPTVLARGCEIQVSDVMTRTQGTRYRYPDIVVSCSPGHDPYLLENPCFIAQVTSESTADTDHGRKLEEYTKLPSLERYAILSQTQRFVIVYKLVNGAWTFETHSDAGEFELPCLAVSLSLDQIYAGVTV